MRQHPVQCTSTAPGAKDRARHYRRTGNPTKEAAPLRCRSTRPGCEGVRHQIPPAASNIPARLTWINSIQFVWLYNPSTSHNKNVTPGQGYARTGISGASHDTFIGLVSGVRDRDRHHRLTAPPAV